MKSALLPRFAYQFRCETGSLALLAESCVAHGLTESCEATGLVSVRRAVSHSSQYLRGQRSRRIFRGHRSRRILRGHWPRRILCGPVSCTNVRATHFEHFKFRGPVGALGAVQTILFWRPRFVAARFVIICLRGFYGGALYTQTKPKSCPFRPWRKRAEARLDRADGGWGALVALPGLQVLRRGGNKCFWP